MALQMIRFGVFILSLASSTTHMYAAVAISTVSDCMFQKFIFDKDTSVRSAVGRNGETLLQCAVACASPSTTSSKAFQLWEGVCYLFTTAVEDDLQPEPIPGSRTAYKRIPPCSSQSHSYSLVETLTASHCVNLMLDKGPVEYTRAKSKCRGRGGSVALLDYAEKIGEILKIYEAENISVTYIWAGACYDFASGTFKDERGNVISSQSSSLWPPGGLPKIVQNGRCLVVNTDSMVLFSEPWSRKYLCVCERFDFYQ